MLNYQFLLGLSLIIFRAPCCFSPDSATIKMSVSNGTIFIQYDIIITPGIYTTWGIKKIIIIINRFV